MKKDDPHEDEPTSTWPIAGAAEDNATEVEDDREWPAGTWYADDDATRAAWDPVPGARTRRWPLAVAALVGAVAMLFTVLAWNVLAGTDDRSASASDADATPVGALSSQDALAPAAAPTVHGATRLSRCTAAARELQEPLAAARPALDQWAVHVGAMNKLVVGEITLRQASDFWNDTRVGAKRNMARFDDALAALRRRGLDCPAPGLLAPGAKALPACARTVQAEVGALRAARVSLATWDVHIHHMDMLRLGQMSPEEATSAWLSSWQQGVRELDDYKAASREAQRADRCARAGAAE